MRSLIVFAFLPFLGGCMTAQQQAINTTQSAVSASLEDCKARYPAGTSRVQQAKCYNEAERPMRAVAPYPDLHDAKWAQRLAVAERIDAGKISVAEGNAEFARLVSDLTSEQERRLAGRRAVEAQESVARTNAISALATTLQPPQPHVVNCRSSMLVPQQVNTTCY